MVTERISATTPRFACPRMGILYGLHDLFYLKGNFLVALFFLSFDMPH